MSNVEFTKLDLKSNEVLTINIKSEEVDPTMAKNIRDAFRKLFPCNEVMVFAMGMDNELTFKIEKDEVLEAPSCNNGGCGACETPCGSEQPDET